MIVKDRFVNNLNLNGKVVQRSFKGKKFSKPEIKKLVGEFQEKYKNKDLILMLGVYTPYGFRNSKQFNINESPSMVDDYEWEDTDRFLIYAWKPTNAIGGTNEKNDCLFNCIQRLLSSYRLPKDFKTDLHLKNYLKLNPCDKVPLNKIPIIEDKLKININVTGDHSYTSPNKYKHQTLHLSLVGEHFEIQKNNLKKKSLMYNIPKREQKLLFVKENGNEIECYDGNTTFTWSLEEYNLERNNFNGEYALLDEFPIIKSDDSDFKENYLYFLTQCEKLKELTYGKIDLSKSGYKISNEALKCVYYSLLSFNEPEEITPSEQEWFYRCMKGGLIFCSNNTTLEYAYNYDKKSAYPSMLCNDHFTFPVKQGEFKLLKELPKILQYGIYRCKIEPTNDEHINKLFRFNSKNYYTHYDINLARDLKLPISLITEETNALLYTKDRGNGATYFRQIVHMLYDLKTKCKLAKCVLNAIWGALCQKNKIKTTTSNSVNLNNGELLIKIQPFGENCHKIHYLKNGHYFKHPYARIGCFLTAACRKQMAEIILPFKEHVHKCHTDSILSDIKMDDLIIGDYIGDFVLEQHGRVHIHHSSKKAVWL